MTQTNEAITKTPAEEIERLNHSLRIVTSHLAEAQEAYERVAGERDRLKAKVEQLLELTEGKRRLAK